MPESTIATFEVRVLLDEFRDDLRRRGMTPATARVYRATVSAVLRKHQIPMRDAEQLAAYVADLRVTRFDHVNVFLAAWSKFRLFMHERHNEELPDLSDTVKMQTDAIFPTEAIFDLRAPLVTLPVPLFLSLTWGDVFTDAEGQVRVVYTSPLTERVVRQVMNEPAVAALRTLQAWGYQRTKVHAGAVLIPSAPDSPLPITRQLFTQLMLREQRRRAELAKTAPAQPFQIIGVDPAEAERKMMQEHRAAAQAEEARKAQERATNPLGGGYDAGGYGVYSERKLMLDAITGQEFYRLWRERTPHLDNNEDRVRSDAIAGGMTENADNRSILAWRRARWEVGEANDFGFPPPGMVIRQVSKVKMVSGPIAPPVGPAVPTLVLDGESNVNSPPEPPVPVFTTLPGFEGPVFDPPPFSEFEPEEEEEGEED